MHWILVNILAMLFVCFRYSNYIYPDVMCFTCAITFQQTLVNMEMYCSFYEDRFTDNTIETNYKSKASRAIMASSKENIDFKKLLY